MVANSIFEDNFILTSMKKVILFSIFCILLFRANAQNPKVVFKTIDAVNNEPLVGANVMVKNTSLAGLTDFNGMITFQSLPTNVNIQFSFIGYETVNYNYVRASINGETSTTNDIIEIFMQKKVFQTAEITINSIRAKNDEPVATTTITADDIKKNNLGQDLPILLGGTTSAVTNSDAGAGVGYTGIRIRGTDITRTNVTINGIPVNDAESQGVFWVNTPDLASSISSLQIQRGVGTSTNGAGSFGASINISTNDLNPNLYGRVSSSFGMFNTFKNTVEFNSGIVGKRFAFSGRLSKITSDGYIDRSWSDLKSFFVSGGYYGKSSFLKFNIFSGKESTYQAWNGVLQSIADTNRTYNSAGTDWGQLSTPYHNETDNYQQDHYQFFVNQQIKKMFNINLALFYTRGRGYYEQYKVNESFSDYGLNNVIIGNDTIIETDLIRQLWLDNHFFGFNLTTTFKYKRWNATLSGGFNRYIGEHYGKVVWAEFASNSSNNGKYYDRLADKNDGNVFAKIQYEIVSGLKIFGDLQYRYVNYNLNGFAGNPGIVINDVFHFFNPKFGVNYDINNEHRVYGYFGVANKEPNRVDYESLTKPKHETLRDYEFGYQYKHRIFKIGVNGFIMDYDNQLINSGGINDVGAYTRINVDKSFRAGGELEAEVNILKNLSLILNFTYSENKIQNFTEYIDNYDLGTVDSINHGLTDIAFSPRIIGGFTLSYSPIKNLYFDITGKYVDKQYLDNTSNDARSLPAFFTNDFRARYGFKIKEILGIDLNLVVSNFTNRMYAPNGYNFSYISGGITISENYLYPMSGINVMGGIIITVMDFKNMK